MITYKTYQEAKINNPKSYILTRHGEFTTKGNVSYLGKHLWHTCNTADYCMTLSDFFDAGHKFVDGDVYLNNAGKVIKVGFDISAKNINYPVRASLISQSFVLSAKALNDQAIEDFYDPDFEQVEWKAGDMCVYLSSDGEEIPSIVIGWHPAQPVLVIQSNLDGDFYEVTSEEIKKPETPEQKKEREEKEAFIKKAREVISGTTETNAAIEKMFEAGMRFK